MARIRLAFLGPPHVELDGTPVRLGTGKAIALMAYLSVIGKPVRCDALVTLLWLRYGRVEGYAALRRTLSAMRRVLGRELMAAEREAVWLPESPHAWIECRRLQEELHKRGETARVEVPPSPVALKLDAPMDPRQTRAETRAAKRWISVLPLANISPDPNDEFTVDGQTEELISAVSKI